jgi:glycosyltransferase involved in cell wall biosynthesis
MKVCFVSTSSALATGGLTAYIGAIANALAPHCAVYSVARFVTTLAFASHLQETPSTKQAGALTIQTIAPNGPACALLPRLSSLVSRPPFQKGAIQTFNSAYESALDAAIPADTTVIHYVGVGWELLGFTAQKIAKRRGLRFIITAFPHPHSWGDSPLDVTLYNTADAMVTMTQFENDYLKQKGVTVPLHEVGLAPALLDGIVGDGARFRQKHGLENRKIILFVGRKDAGKGYLVLREAVHQLSLQMPEAILVAAGPDGAPTYPPIAPESFLDLGVLKPTLADQQEKADAFAACDVYAMPSEHESFGIVYTEAWQAKKPVIAGLSPAVQQLVSEGVDGFCVAQDPEKIKTALQAILTNPQKAKEMGESGYAKQQAKYTWPIICQKHLAIYNQE